MAEEIHLAAEVSGLWCCACWLAGDQSTCLLCEKTNCDLTLSPNNIIIFLLHTIKTNFFSDEQLNLKSGAIFILGAFENGESLS